jgi:predicted flap endonuclease-1-like 5' DNA nuclease
MPVHINKLRGISYELKMQLEAQGFKHSHQVFVATRTVAGRKSFAKTFGLDDQVVQKLANKADLARIRGIGGVFSDLLEHVGIHTVKDLATCTPDKLYTKLREINTQLNIVGRLPTRKAVNAWVAQAQELSQLE